PTYSYEVLTSQVSGLLSKKVELSPRIITFFCEKLNTLKGISYPSNFLEVPLPCLGMLNSYMILKSFTLGAQGVALVPCECRYSLESNFSSELAFSRRILENFGIEAERVRIFEPKESFSRELEGFCHEIENMKQPISHVTPEEREEEPELSNLLKTMKGNYAFKKQKLFGEEVPFGLLSLDEKMCTLCDVCVRNCYSDALEIVRGKDTLRLFFNHSRCNGCERCIDFCHERALSMKKGLDLALLEEKKLLMEDKEERCKICGSFLGSSNLLQKISERASEEKKEPEYIKLCYTCRIKASLIP
ncbi:MAG: hydrogenase iron-sulfur subunit, partial [Candidatus Methanofastidiosia archaeon]